MRKALTTLLLAFLAANVPAQVVVDTALVPLYTQGINGTNNNRVPCWFWVELSGLTPNATYRYYTTMDTIGAAANSNGAGVPLLINAVSGTIRRTTNPSLSNSANHDSLTADSAGMYKGWFGVDASGNGRYTPGNTIYPKLIMNNGTPNSTATQTRLLLSDYPITVINFGTNNAATEGTALYDSLDALPKNFICTYDNVNAAGRPVTISIVENDGLDLYLVTSTASFYQNNVDTLNGRWGAIIPNTLAAGIQALEERAFIGGTPVDTVIDSDGFWCYGVNTANMAGGNAGIYLNSTFTLSASAIIPDTAYTGIAANFSAVSNSPYATYTWNYGDLSVPGSGMNTSHTYSTNGIVTVTVVITTGGCTDSVTGNVNVLLGTGVQSIQPLRMDIFPNPADEEISIVTHTQNEKIITVYNTLGVPVKTQIFQGTRYVLNIQDLDQGLYFVEVRDETLNRKGLRQIVVQ